MAGPHKVIEGSDGSAAECVRPSEEAAVLQHMKRFARPDNFQAKLVHLFPALLGYWGLPFLFARCGASAKVALVVLQALCTTKLFIIFHDLGHCSFLAGGVSQNKFWHKVASFALMVPVSWAEGHAMHHAHVGNAAQDVYEWNETVTLTVRDYRGLPPTRRLAYRVLREPLVFFPLASFWIFFVYGSGRKGATALARWKEQFIRAVSGSLLLSGLVVTAPPGKCAQAVASYCFARLLAGTLGIILFHAQHTFNPAYVVTEEWSIFASGQRGSSFLQVPAALEWFTGGIEYHHIHHTCPMIPGYKLRDCNDAAPPGMMKPTKLTLSDVWRCGRLTLYDEDKKLYMSFAEEAASRSHDDS